MKKIYQALLLLSVSCTTTASASEEPFADLRVTIQRHIEETTEEFLEKIFRPLVGGEKKVSASDSHLGVRYFNNGSESLYYTFNVTNNDKKRIYGLSIDSSTRCHRGGDCHILLLFGDTLKKARYSDVSYLAPEEPQLWPYVIGLLRKFGTHTVEIGDEYRDKEGLPATSVPERIKIFRDCGFTGTDGHLTLQIQ